MSDETLNPYVSLPSEAFWRTAVAEVAAVEMKGLWSPKWPIGPQTRIATAGSCFAQHFGAALRARQFAWVDAEPAPGPLPPDRQHAYGYGLFSSRTGNIYTARQLLQWLQWSIEPTAAPQEIWAQDGRYFDPFRPSIEPKGFRSREELLASRMTTFRCFIEAVKAADVFVFTLGLTECWRNIDTLCEYPSCPGAIAGEFDPGIHYFHNQTFSEILADMGNVISLLRRLQPELRLILTVSPVPLTATASGRHVLVATSHSKSILRSVAGELEANLSFCDYFPSYEVITAPPFRGMFYAPNLRSVSQFGVDFVMDRFFNALEIRPTENNHPHWEPRAESNLSDPLCDEAALDNFASA
jgi:GSCFA family